MAKHRHSMAPTAKLEADTTRYAAESPSHDA
jgi:hypothetical protein